jgi:hypothetical protein
LNCPSGDDVLLADFAPLVDRIAIIQNSTESWGVSDARSNSLGCARRSSSAKANLIDGKASDHKKRPTKPNPESLPARQRFADLNLELNVSGVLRALDFDGEFPSAGMR